MPPTHAVHYGRPPGVKGGSRNRSGVMPRPDDGWTSCGFHEGGIEVDGQPLSVLPLDEQRAAHFRHAGTAYEALLVLLGSETTRRRVIELSNARLVEGFDQYGDAMFRQSYPELLRETDEELADALNRMVAALHRLATLGDRAALELLATVIDVEAT